MAAEASTPVTCAPLWAIWALSSPLPQPRSRMRSPAAGRSQSDTRSRLDSKTKAWRSRYCPAFQWSVVESVIGFHCTGTSAGQRPAGSPRYTPGVNLADFQLLPDDLRPAALRDWVPAQGERLGAAALALGAGLPDLARCWAHSAGPAGAALEAAAALRLGLLQEALTLIGPLPGDARRAVLLARAYWLGGDSDVHWAEAARTQARLEGMRPP